VVDSGRSPIAPPGSCVPASRPDGRRRRPHRPLRVALPLGAAVRRSGVMGSPPPPRRVHGHEVLRRPVPPGPAPGNAPAGLGPSQGTPPRFRVPASRPGPSPPGVLRTLGDVGSRVRSSRGCLPRHVPSSRSRTSSTVCSPRALRPGGRCRPGFSVAFPRPPSDAEPPHGPVSGTVRLRGPCRGVTAPPALRNRRRKTPRRRTARGPCALVVTSADVLTGAPGRSPPEHSIPHRRGDRRRHAPPPALSSRPPR
jgi:hypothetical protein